MEVPLSVNMPNITKLAVIGNMIVSHIWEELQLHSKMRPFFTCNGINEELVIPLHLKGLVLNEGKYAKLGLWSLSTGQAVLRQDPDVVEQHLCVPFTPASE